MFNKPYVTAVLCLLLSWQAAAQDILGNKDIISMTAAKVSPSLVLTKISSSKCKFDLTTPGLINLRQSKVSDAVVKAMLTASPPTDVMTNEDVIQLNSGDVSRQIITEKMRLAPTRFDTSVEGMIALKNAKVPDVLTKAMMTAPSKAISAKP